MPDASDDDGRKSPRTPVRLRSCRGVASSRGGGEEGGVPKIEGGCGEDIGGVAKV